MIFLTGHGKTAVPDVDVDAYGTYSALPVSQVCGYTRYEEYGEPTFGPFGYFFPAADELPGVPGRTAALDALADAMVEDDPQPTEDSAIPPIFTYLGQFIDHDVTANTDRETGLSIIDVDEVDPVARNDVAGGLGNLRAGALNLDSLYGGGPVQGPFSKALADILRFTGDRAKLWIGTLTDVGFGTVPLPNDIAGDLLRLGRIIREPFTQISEDDLRALPEPLRSTFVNPDDTIKVQRAIIGDMRNDENLAVAQLHLAFARLHNKIVDEAHHHVADPTDREAVFVWARKMVTWHYQWLVLNSYLPSICDPDVLARVLERGASVYGHFLARTSPPRPDLMPMPLEFSVAAFRFGHSMARASYDWNRFFGREAGGSAPFLERASFRQLFEFTGGAAQPMPVPGQDNAPTLPSHWPIEWDRFALSVPDDMKDRSARKIDTLLAEPLSDMFNEDPGIFRHLARRNLRRGHRLNVPPAQACLASLSEIYGYELPALTPDQLRTGATADALQDGGFVEATPLWFYVLKEAEVLGQDGRLGPLGSTLVAETLAGLAIHDPSSYWHQNGSDGGRWQPADGVRPGGHVIESMPAMLRAAGVL